MPYPAMIKVSSNEQFAWMAMMVVMMQHSTTTERDLNH